MKRVVLFLILSASVVFSSCAPKYSSATAKPVSTLSCKQMEREQMKLASIRDDASGKAGFSKENVMWALFFLPGMVVNEMDNRDVINKVDRRTEDLTDEQAKKGCI